MLDPLSCKPGLGDALISSESTHAAGSPFGDALFPAGLAQFWARGAICLEQLPVLLLPGSLALPAFCARMGVCLGVSGSCIRELEPPLLHPLKGLSGRGSRPPSTTSWPRALILGPSVLSVVHSATASCTHHRATCTSQCSNAG